MRKISDRRWRMVLPGCLCGLRCCRRLVRLFQLFQQHHEFIATDAGDCVAAAQMTREAARHINQQLVTERMA